MVFLNIQKKKVSSLFCSYWSKETIEVSLEGEEKILMATLNPCFTSYAHHKSQP